MHFSLIKLYPNINGLAICVQLSEFRLGKHNFIAVFGIMANRWKRVFCDTLNQTNNDKKNSPPNCGLTRAS